MVGPYRWRAGLDRGYGRCRKGQGGFVVDLARGENGVSVGGGLRRFLVVDRVSNELSLLLGRRFEGELPMQLGYQTTKTQRTARIETGKFASDRQLVNWKLWHLDYLGIGVKS